MSVDFDSFDVAFLSPTDTPNTGNNDIPTAAIICIAIIGWIVFVLLMLVVRKLVKRKYPEFTCETCTNNCRCPAVCSTYECPVWCPSYPSCCHCPEVDYASCLPRWCRLPEVCSFEGICANWTFCDNCRCDCCDSCECPEISCDCSPQCDTINCICCEIRCK